MDDHGTYAQEKSVSPPTLAKPLGYPLVIQQFAIENGPVEIVRFPMNSVRISHNYVNVYPRVYVFH